MANEMSRFKETANAHMKRDIDVKGKWTCACEACSEIRSMFGLEKMLALRPLVRELQELGDKLAEISESPERQMLLQRYLSLHDQLAAEMAK